MRARQSAAATAATAARAATRPVDRAMRATAVATEAAAADAETAAIAATARTRAETATAETAAVATALEVNALAEIQTLPNRDHRVTENTDREFQDSVFFVSLCSLYGCAISFSGYRSRIISSASSVGAR